MLLQLQSNSVSNPLTLNLTNFVNVQQGQGLDNYDPQFTQKVWGRSMLKEGATLALEQLTEKGLTFPLLLNAPMSVISQLCPNPGFEWDTAGSGPAWWSQYNPNSQTFAAFAVSTSFAASGVQSLHVSVASLGAGDYVGLQGSTRIPVTAGNSYTLSAIVDGISVPTGVFVDIQWYTSGGSYISGNVSASVTTGQNTVSVSAVAPPTAASALISVQLCNTTGSAAAAEMYVDDVSFTQGAPSQYVDGDQFGCQWSGLPGQSTSSGPTTSRMVEQINQVVNTSGAVCQWQGDNNSIATTFDVLSGQFDVAYDYRRDQRNWLGGNLRVFTQPLGRTAAARPYAAASAAGPLLMISPYASSGPVAVGASTQAGVAGYGGAPQGPSSGVFYWGNPWLAGDAPAKMLLDFTIGAVNASLAMVSLLPDKNYNPQPVVGVYGASPGYYASVPGGVVHRLGGPGSTSLFVGFVPTATDVPVGWAGAHRIMALARASGVTCQLTTYQNALVEHPVTANVLPTNDWCLYDLGTFRLSGSETTRQGAFGLVAIGGAVPSISGTGVNAALDVASLYMLPDNNTWFAGAGAGALYLTDAQGWNRGIIAATPTNMVLIDDQRGDQFYVGDGSGPYAANAASPIGIDSKATKITPASRGLVPQPDPRDGAPIIAILGVGANGTYPQWSISAQLQIVERCRYVFP